MRDVNEGRAQPAIDPAFGPDLVDMKRAAALLGIKAEPLLLDVKATAVALSVSTRTVAEMTRRGLLPHVRLRRRVLYPLDRVREYIASITKGGPSA
jgi:excisionase family DNA binding protein